MAGAPHAASARTAPGALGPPAASVGVEEEFLIADAALGTPVPRAPEVIRTAARGPALPGGTQLKGELQASQAEAASGVCTRLSDLARQLRAGRQRLAAAAHHAGLLLLSTGTPVLPGAAATLSEGARYERIARMYAGVVADYEACGCHVHVGVPDRETAVAVVNHLRPWLPSLLALSANSPFHHARDTGYASWRTVQQSRFPGFGVPPYFSSLAAHDAQLERLVECGTLADVRQSFWLARPSAVFPTVELRAADAAATAGEAVLQAALSRALVRTALAALSEGREARPVPDQIAAAAVWTAARHGMRGPGVHPLAERSTTAVALVHELLAHVTPALEETGDLECVRHLLAGVVERGTGAERQRAAAAEGTGAVVSHLARETVRTPGSLGPVHNPSTARRPGRPPALPATVARSAA